MAVQFRPLPSSLFDPKVRPHIERLNRDLRDLYGLEGVLNNPLVTRRSDSSIVRRSQTQVDVSRITPPIDQVVSGASTVVGTPNLTFGTANVIGSTTTALSVDSTLALFGAQAALDPGYTATVGSSAFAARADHQHRYPELLNVAGSSDTVTLTDDGTEGALFTASASFSVNAMALMVPNGTTPLRVGIYGNIAMGQTLLDTILVRAVKQDYNETAATPGGMNFTITNTNVGSGGIAARGIQGTISASMASAGALSTNSVIACELNPTGGLISGNSRFQGTVAGYRTSMTMASATVGTPGVLMEGYRASGTVQRIALTDYVGFRSISPSVSFSGSITNVYGVLVDSLGTGTNRWGMKAANKLETTGSDGIASGAAGDKGWIVRGSDDTTQFLRLRALYNGGVPILAIDAVGTTLPAT